VYHLVTLRSLQAYQKAVYSASNEVETFNLQRHTELLLRSMLRQAISGLNQSLSIAGEKTTDGEHHEC